MLGDVTARLLALTTERLSLVPLTAAALDALIESRLVRIPARSTQPGRAGAQVSGSRS
jgi:hypothetical protein